LTESPAIGILEEVSTFFVRLETYGNANLLTPTCFYSNSRTN